MNMNFKRKLPIPMEIKEQFPLSYKHEQMKEKRDIEIKNIFEGKDDRFILVIGPCSVGHFLRTVHTCYPFLFSAPAFALV